MVEIEVKGIITNSYSLLKILTNFHQQVLGKVAKI